MSKAFEIVQTKALDLLTLGFNNIFSFKIQIYAASLESFVKFVESSLIENSSGSSLASYVKIINDSHFFSLDFTDEMAKVNNELEFIWPFTKLGSENSQLKLDWNNCLKTRLLFKDILDEAKMIIFGPGDTFSNFSEQNKLITKGYLDDTSKQLKNCFETLVEAYQNKATVENNKGEEKYYFYEPDKKFMGFNQVPYTEQQPYTEQVSYIEKVPCEATESYSETQRFYYGAHNHKYRCDSEASHTRYSTRPSIFGMKISPKHFHWDYGIRSEVPCHPENVTLTRKVIKYEDITKHKDVVKYQTVTKYNSVPIYQDIEIRKFNEKKYDDDIKVANTNIESERSQISNFLKEICAINASKKANFSLNRANEVENQAKLECSKAGTCYDSIGTFFC